MTKEEMIVKTHKTMMLYNAFILCCACVCAYFISTWCFLLCIFMLRYKDDKND